MTRISSSPIPIVPADRPGARTTASTGTPFFAALRAADRTQRPAGAAGSHAGTPAGGAPGGAPFDPSPEVATADGGASSESPRVPPRRSSRNTAADLAQLAAGAKALVADATPKPTPAAASPPVTLADLLATAPRPSADDAAPDTTVPSDDDATAPIAARGSSRSPLGKLAHTDAPTAAAWLDMAALISANHGANHGASAAAGATRIATAAAGSAIAGAAAPTASLAGPRARPASSTDPVVNADSAPAAGSIAEALAAVTDGPKAGSHTEPDGLPVASSLAEALGRLTGATPDPATGTAAVAPDPGFDATAKPWTPLEQAVHDLIGEFTERTTTREHGDPVETPAPSELTAVHAVDSFNAFNAVAQVPTGDPAPSRVAPTAATHAALPIQLPEPPANPSHVHLVVDDGPERVVVTVAMRGNDVHVALRSSDDSTTAALARNAASLDHAMRARGLALGEFTTERELPQQSRHHQPEPEPQERRKPDAEPFELEETP